ncbi:MAG: hypothetical protein AABZ06_07185 [Bdellovibrionota bacterium]
MITYLEGVATSDPTCSGYQFGTYYQWGYLPDSVARIPVLLNGGRPF